MCPAWESNRQLPVHRMTLINWATWTSQEISLFFSGFFNTISLSLVFHSFIIISISSDRDVLGFLNLWTNVSNYFRNLFSHYLPKYCHYLIFFLSYLSGALIENMLDMLTLSSISLDFPFAFPLFLYFFILHCRYFLLTHLPVLHFLTRCIQSAHKRITCSLKLK